MTPTETRKPWPRPAALNVQLAKVFHNGVHVGYDMPEAGRSGRDVLKIVTVVKDDRTCRQSCDSVWHSWTDPHEPHVHRVAQRPSGRRPDVPDGLPDEIGHTASRPPCPRRAVEFLRAQIDVSLDHMCYLP